MQRYEEQEEKQYEPNIQAPYGMRKEESTSLAFGVEAGLGPDIISGPETRHV